MKISLQNIQAIEKAMFNLPDRGLVQILGANSNGKSILMRAVEYVGKLRILDTSDRNTLIRDGYDEGRILMNYGNRILDVHLHRDAQYCYVTLFRDAADAKNPEKRVTRFFREGGIDKLVEEFGWCYYSKGNVCLQLHEQYGSIPFVSSTPALDAELVEAVTTDTIAQEFLAKFKTITYPKAKQQNEQLNEKIASTKRVLEKLTLFDIPAYKQALQELTEAYSVVENLQILHLTKLSIPKNVTFLNITGPVLSKLKFPVNNQLINVYGPKLCRLPVYKESAVLVEPLTNLSGMIYNLRKLEEGTCPMCGQPLCSCKEVD